MTSKNAPHGHNERFAPYGVPSNHKQLPLPEGFGPMVGWPEPVEGEAPARKAAKRK